MADCGNWQLFSPLLDSYTDFTPSTSTLAGWEPSTSTWAGWEPCQETPGTPPTVIPPGIPDQVNAVGDSGNLDISPYFDEGTGSTPVYTAPGLPAGASMDTAGLITYDFLAESDINVIVTLSTGVNPDAHDLFNWLVSAATSPPSVIPPGIPDQVNVVGQSGTLDISPYFDEGTGGTPVYSQINLPAGATMDTAGLITYDFSAEADVNPTITLATGVAPDAADQFRWEVIPAIVVDGWATESGDNWETESGARWVLEG